MVKKRKNLADAFKEEPTPTPADEPERPEPNTGPNVPATRRKRRMVAGYFDLETSKQLKILCAEKDVTLQNLLREAINDIFTKYGKPPIA